MGSVCGATLGAYGERLTVVYIDIVLITQRHQDPAATIAPKPPVDVEQVPANFNLLCLPYGMYGIPSVVVLADMIKRSGTGSTVVLLIGFQPVNGCNMILPTYWKGLRSRAYADYYRTGFQTRC